MVGDRIAPRRCGKQKGTTARTPIQKTFLTWVPPFAQKSWVMCDASSERTYDRSTCGPLQRSSRKSTRQYGSNLRLSMIGGFQTSSCPD